LTKQLHFLIMNLVQRSKVYREFYTNGAVAWFTAGVISPLFISKLEARILIASAISVIASFVFLRLAIDHGMENK